MTEIKTYRGLLYANSKTKDSDWKPMYHLVGLEHTDRDKAEKEALKLKEHIRLDPDLEYHIKICVEEINDETPNLIHKLTEYYKSGNKN